MGFSKGVITSFLLLVLACNITHLKLLEVVLMIAMAVKELYVFTKKLLL